MVSFIAFALVIWEKVPNNSQLSTLYVWWHFFFLPPISVPTHYRILSVPLPCLILIFPLVGFISFLSPLTLNSPTLRLHTNHSSFNTPLRRYNIMEYIQRAGQQSIHTCIKQFIIGKMTIRLYLITWRIVWSCNLRLQFSVSWRPLQAQLADNSIHDGTVFSMAHSNVILQGVGHKNQIGPTSPQLSYSLSNKTGHWFYRFVQGILWDISDSHKISLCIIKSEMKMIPQICPLYNDNEPTTLTLPPTELQWIHWVKTSSQGQFGVSKTWAMPCVLS